MMRWIAKDSIEACLNAAWRDGAKSALKSISEADPAERKKIFKRASSVKVWRDFYELLPQNLKNKCWYCEAEEIRSDVPVDHFRPKAKIEDDETHPGYWWLAFDWENYRCACEFCNSRRNFEESSGGKGCRFPLVDPATRVRSPADDMSNELPDFLDPFEPGDDKLLWFDEDGYPVPKPDCSDAEKKKVTNSIEIFHLHEARISRKRNDVRIAVMRHVKALESGRPADVRSAKIELLKMVRDTAILSRTAIVYLRAYRMIPAVKEILELD